jgi:hypothetical protein
MHDFRQLARLGPSADCSREQSRYAGGVPSSTVVWVVIGFNVLILVAALIVASAVAFGGQYAYRHRFDHPPTPHPESWLARKLVVVAIILGSSALSRWPHMFG